MHAWYTTGMELLGKGSPAAAAQVLQRAANAEPASRSVREALARAQFDTGQYAAAAENFRVIVEASPTDDYAHFGLGLSLARAGDHEAAAEYLALAAAMRPDRKHYTDALRQVRATLKFRSSPGGTTLRTPRCAGPARLIAKTAIVSGAASARSGVLGMHPARLGLLLPTDAD